MAATVWLGSSLSAGLTPCVGIPRSHFHFDTSPTYNSVMLPSWPVTTAIPDTSRHTSKRGTGSSAGCNATSRTTPHGRHAISRSMPDAVPSRCHPRPQARPRVTCSATTPTSVKTDASDRHGERRVCQLYVLDGLTPYEPAWSLQKALVAERVAARREASPLRDALLLLEHPPVYTLGTGSSAGHLRFDADDPPYGARLYRTERGGEVTYHGPGQIVMYPILDLQAHHTPDLHLYLRQLEEVVIRALESAVGIRAGRVEGRTGVWHAGAKLAAIGVRATSWVTYHGLALNVTTDLAPFDRIVPCGISDRAVGSVRGQLVGDAYRSDDLLLAHMRAHLLAAFAGVFGVELEGATPPPLPAVTNASVTQDASSRVP